MVDTHVFQMWELHHDYELSGFHHTVQVFLLSSFHASVVSVRMLSMPSDKSSGAISGAVSVCGGPDVLSNLLKGFQSVLNCHDQDRAGMMAATSA